MIDRLSLRRVGGVILSLFCRTELNEELLRRRRGGVIDLETDLETLLPFSLLSLPRGALNERERARWRPTARPGAGDRERELEKLLALPLSFLTPPFRTPRGGLKERDRERRRSAARPGAGERDR